MAGEHFLPIAMGNQPSLFRSIWNLLVTDGITYSTSWGDWNADGWQDYPLDNGISDSIPGRQG